MFDKIFVQLLQKKGVTAYQVSKDLGITQGLMSKWKNGSSNPGAKHLTALADYFGVSVEYLLGEEDKLSPPKGVKIPVYGRIAAGIPIEAIEDIIDYEEIPEAMSRSGDYLALQIQGDSMEPRMYSGDVVIIKKQPDCESGQVCAVYINGYEATLKKVVKRAGGITLIPFNSAYPPINYTIKEISELPITILGVAVELRGKL